MKRSRPTLAATLTIAIAMTLSAEGRVSTEQADRLQRDLTPVGAERAGDAEGNIPAWEGGLSAAPTCFKATGDRYCNPFPADAPLFTIEADTLAKYQDDLTPGQVEMFRKYAGTYSIRVFPTRRTFANPSYVYDAVRANAIAAKLENNVEAVQGASIGVLFPIPANGREVIWNHKLRYRDPSATRTNNQMTVSSRGTFEQTQVREDLLFSARLDWRRSSKRFLASVVGERTA